MVVIAEQLLVSAGQVVSVPLHTSAGSHAPVDARHAWLGGSNAHTPLTDAPAATEHPWQSPLPPAQAELQQTPSTQKPLPQVEAEVHAVPLAAPVTQTPPLHTYPVAQL